MFRYMALIWNTENPQQSDAVELLSRRIKATSPLWQEVMDQEGMRVFCADARPGSLEPYFLANRAGVILGALFERNHDACDPTPSRKAVLGTTQTAAIVNSRGRCLVTNFWGNYVAFVGDPGGRNKWVIKDPTGSLPCFSTQYRGVTLIFSCIEDCLHLDLSFSVDPAYLRSRMISSGLREHPPLKEVAQVNRGECVEIDPHSDPALVSRCLYWTPLNFRAADDMIEDPDRAALAMRATVRAATHALAGNHDSALLRLSGGLDSSIISGCLKGAPGQPWITCYTNYNPRGRSDERPWARLAAQHAGWEHIETAVVPEDLPLAAALRMPPTVEPALALDYLQRNTFEKTLAADRAATAVFTGDGGDSGFCSDSINFAVSEYLLRHGLQPRILRLASQVAVLRELSTWAVLARSFRTWMHGANAPTQRDAWIKACRLVNPELLQGFTPIEYQDHPWFRGVERTPGGMPTRIGMLLATPDFYSGYANADESAPEVVSPLYSQPAIELFLRIPIHVHFENGRDRGLARRAFGPDVPQPILQRHWKDRGPGFHDELIHRNLPFLRELFLDGVLVKEGLLNRTALEQALSTAPTKSDVFPGEILNHLGVEIWMRHWTNSPRQRAAA